MTSESRHTALVHWAKIALPLSALVLLSTLFLFSGKVDPTTAAIYSKVDVTTLAREQRLTAPEFSGVTEDGAALTVQAATAAPDPSGNGASASKIIAKLEEGTGVVTDMRAKTGRIDPASGQISLSDGVAVQTSSGYRISTERVDMATDRTSLSAPGTVEAKAPFGTLHAGQMQIDATDPKTGSDLVFKGGVKLIYQPQK
ncbi:lipopolysaccharide export system protein LptC [Rhodobacter viridis]|uniref:Lipopolysaccharide export system protein LptC n=1 Tax=Rhodobacter viridis TaxID=1054202 RepID=A0A318U928_9RHOB|nr:hypothetical protein [Rhodobacter viridis]PYF11833.1 lipopolysaccharide export system protein LptC [Rhodobacter viridis]